MDVEGGCSRLLLIVIYLIVFYTPHVYDPMTILFREIEVQAYASAIR